MRVFIMSDMEGVAGISKWEQVSGGESLYEEGRKLYTEEINAAVRGAAAAGADEIVVMDCHGAGKGWTFNSLVPDMLDERCEFVVQNEWTEYSGVLEDGCDAALLIAMHARAGTGDGVLSHTVSGTQWQELRFNGAPVGETGINAALCGMYDCPVVLVSGDRATCAEARELLGDGLKTVEVKEGFGRFSARHISPRRARTLIEQTTRDVLALTDTVAPYKLEPPVEIEVRLAQPEHAEKYRYRDGVDLTDARTIVCRADDWWTAWKRVFF